MLTREFYRRDARQVAPELLGKLLVHKTPQGIRSGMIVETEAYLGPEDAASHAYQNKRTVRTEILFGPAGYAYVYLIYGMYHCLNVVVNEENRPEAVLIRAVEPIEGIVAMLKTRNCKDIKNLSNGPGKLCQALGINQQFNGLDLCGQTLFITDHQSIKTSEIGVSPRVNIEYAGEYKDRLWRYYMKENPFVSKDSRKL